MSVTYRVAEQFVSINGEGTRAGELAVFVRLCGCNLQCSYCDTQWANQPDVSYQLQTTEEIIQAILETGVRNVTLTGGEPLLTPNVAELIAAITAQPTLSLEIETNGSVPLQSFAAIQPRPIFTMDYKLPSSGMEHKMCLENMQLLYEKLPLSAYDRDIIDSIFCCMQSRNAMTEKLAYYAGLSDALEFLKQ